MLGSGLRLFGCHLCLAHFRVFGNPRRRLTGLVLLENSLLKQGEGLCSLLVVRVPFLFLEALGFLELCLRRLRENNRRVISRRLHKGVEFLEEWVAQFDCDNFDKIFRGLRGLFYRKGFTQCLNCRTPSLGRHHCVLHFLDRAQKLIVSEEDFLLFVLYILLHRCRHASVKLRPQFRVLRRELLSHSIILCSSCT